MLRNDLQQYDWLLAALVAGVALAVLIALVYLALWRPRGAVAGEQAPTPGSLAGWIAQFVPWVLIVSFVGVTIFGIVYTVRSMLHTPNW